MSKTSIDTLLKAAAYLDRNETDDVTVGELPVKQVNSASRFAGHHHCEVDHGYASTQPMPYQHARRRTRSRSKVSGSLLRYTHNELEKSRRANLKRSLDRLKALVPLGPNETRHTTLSLLEKAQEFIRVLEERSKKGMMELEQLMRYRDYWNQRLNEAAYGKGQYRERCRSDGSPVSVSDSASSEQDTVDVIGGYGSQSSDVDETSSDVDYAMQSCELNVVH